MKKLDIFKTIQLIIFIILAGVCAYSVLFTPEVFHTVSTDSSVRIVCILLWIVLGISFLFLFLDFSFFSSFKRNYRDLKYAVHSDPVAGIANRFSCDMIIEKYLDKELPENFGCIMFTLTNIMEINNLYGHIEGNTLIKDFANILRMASVDLCFVGRNGGNKFLAIFEDTTEEKMNTFLERVQYKIVSHNAGDDTHPIEYTFGSAYHEEKAIGDITSLISLANRRSEKSGGWRT